MAQDTIIQPFDMNGIERGADGIARYRNRPRTVIEMLRASVDRVPNGEAVVEIGAQPSPTNSSGIVRRVWPAACAPPAFRRVRASPFAWPTGSIGWWPSSVA